MSTTSVDDLIDSYEAEGKSEDKSENNPTENTDSAVPVDDGPDPVINGLEFDQIKRLLAEKHDLLISKDDPAIVYITIFNAALERADTANLAHVEKLVSFVDLAIARLNVEVNDAVKPVAELALNTQFKAMLDEARLHATESNKIHASMKRLAIGLGVVSMIVSLAALSSVILFFAK